MKLVKSLLIVSFAALALTPFLSAAESCSASARACSADCSISSPPGGTTTCISGFNHATCVAFDANGNQTGYSSDSCSIVP